MYVPLIVPTLATGGVAAVAISDTETIKVGAGSRLGWGGGGC